MELVRIGYGSLFNKLIINDKEKTIQKICINELGEKKIRCEILFYSNVAQKIPFIFPKFYYFEQEPFLKYTMEYLKDYKPLYLIYNNLNIYERNNLIGKIYDYLRHIHSLEKQILKKEEYIELFLKEAYYKVLDRHSSCSETLKKYNEIKRVNNFDVLEFKTIIEILKKNLLILISKKNIYEIFIIHGDPQFNNILYCEDTRDIKFIDPRGYFGDKELLGIMEYDYAKVLFALSGYDEFDNKNIDYIDINRANINININVLDNTIFNELSIELLLMLTIWCSNFSMFFKNEFKMVQSFFIARYYSSFVIKKFNLK